METVKIEDALTGEVLEFVIIDRGNDEFTSMLKSDYEASLKDAAK